MTRNYGSYIRNDIAGLGASDDSSLSLADQVMLQILSPVTPQLVTEWAQQNGDISWQEITALSNYQLYPINDAQIVAVATTATSVPTTLAVVAPFLSFASSIKQVFEGTPYAYSLTEAVYAQADTAEPPRIYFLYWLTLRPQADPKRGNTSLNFAATQVGGILSYVHEVPSAPSDRPAPAMTFQAALARQSGQTPTPAPEVPMVVTGPAPTTPNISVQIPPLQPGQQQTPSPVQASAAGSTTKAVMIVAVGAAAAFVGYHFFQSRKGG